jgi:hypothetical protein
MAHGGSAGADRSLWRLTIYPMPAFILPEYLTFRSSEQDAPRERCRGEAGGEL